MRRIRYQDPYNSHKVWEVSHLKGGFYLKQYISGRQWSRGRRVTKRFLEMIGVLSMPIVSINEH
ncbi:hypothetical protein [Dubosiella newyorkensis]|uniref:hypothetical protein n=1 Tax=Dubosiella newyorkensis TaxID=1862672 RepID=UPI00272AB0F7|nr:hypothetical protein [Dubosiella newyorkensis]